MDNINFCTAINPLSVIYHEGQDRCYYFGRNQTWKSATLADLPDSTAYYMCKSGPLQQPNWPEMSHSLMTPSPPTSPPLSPHVSFPPSAFWPVQVQGSLPLNIPMPNPTPIQPSTMTDQQIPLSFSTFWNPFPFEMYWQFLQPEVSPSDIWSTNYMEPAYHSAPFTSPPNPS